LPLGMLRIRPRGSAGGHNGMKSIIGALETGDFPRLRLGVRPDRGVEDYVSYLLQPFRPSERKAIEEMLELAAEAVGVILSEGVQRAMNRFNRKVPPSES
jgi:peptidyl-tRNA hydrolase, PTH1 family